MHPRNIFAFGFATFETALNSLGNCQRLRNREGNRRVDGDALISHFFKRFNAGFACGSFNLNVRRETCKLARVLSELFGILIECRVGLEGNFAALSVSFFVHGLKQFCSLQAESLDNFPSNVVFGVGRIVGDNFF